MLQNGQKPSTWTLNRLHLCHLSDIYVASLVSIVRAMRGIHLDRLLDCAQQDQVVITASQKIIQRLSGRVTS
jgi:hypothetical protein